VGMGLDVDEAGRDREPLGVDHLGGFSGEGRPDRSDPAADYGEVAALARRAGTVEQLPAANQEGVRHALLASVCISIVPLADFDMTSRGPLRVRMRQGLAGPDLPGMARLTANMAGATLSACGHVRRRTGGAECAAQPARPVGRSSTEQRLPPRACRI